MMESHRLLIIFIVYFLCVASGHPPRPLNERSPDLTWQAWLLVDDRQQQQQGNPDGTLRRRITPKSVFIAPTFSPDSFPACADGYSSDPMGRCVKIIKLDQDAHYEFLIEKLKQKFSSLDYEDEDEEEEEVIQPTSGPLQLNIPLNVNGEDLSSEESSRETDVAIIVSPTKPGFDFKAYNFDKRDSSDDEANQEVLLKKLNQATTKTQREVATVTAQVPVESTTTTPTVPTTTITDPTTTTEEPSITTTTTQDYPTTLTEETPETSTETEVTVPTTTDSTTTIDSTTNIVTQSPKPDDPSSSIVEELKSMKLNLTTLPPNSGFVRFPDETPVRRVKFPDSHVPSSLDHIASMNDNANERTVIVDSQRGSERSFPDGNFRKRDDHKGLFMIPPRWNPSSFQKPLVLRFSRKHAFIDKNHFNYPNYYRSIPPDDFEYLFKFKNRQR